MRVVLGGTFDPLHTGHRRLLEHALRLAGDDGSVHIGLVTDAYSAQKRDRQVAPWDERARRLKAWFSEHGMPDAVQINPLQDAFGPSVEGDYDVIVASVETTPTAHQVNQERERRKLPALRVETVPYTLGQDLLPITATRVAKGLIDPEGARLQPLHVSVGSTNPVKVRATGHALRRFLPRVRLEIHPARIESGVPDQPHGEQAAAGARRRAEAALEQAQTHGAEYGVGIEAGVMLDPYSGILLDVQHCMIVDPTGYTTHGHGSGFAYPPEIARKILEDGADVSQAFAPLTQDPRLGRHEGAVGWLTHGALDRTRLTEQAVEAALVPRVRRDLYEVPERAQGTHHDPAPA